MRLYHYVFCLYLPQLLKLSTKFLNSCIFEKKKKKCPQNLYMGSFCIYVLVCSVTSYCFYYLALREKCPPSEFFWFLFSRIRTEYWEILRISLYPVWMRENTDQKKLRIWTLFKQCCLFRFSLLIVIIILKTTIPLRELWSAFNIC